MSPEGGLGAVPNPLALRHLGLTASQEVGGLRNAAVTRALRPRTALTVVKYHAWCGSGGVCDQINYICTQIFVSFEI